MGFEKQDLHTNKSRLVFSYMQKYTNIIYCVAGYIGGNNVWRIARKREKITIGGYKFGGYGTIATPSPGVYAVGEILVDLILVV